MHAMTYSVRYLLRSFALMLWLGLVWALPASAAPQPQFYATASGGTAQLTLNATLLVADADVGKMGKSYLAFYFNQQWYFNNGTQWVPYSGGTAPAYATATLVDRVVEIVRATDMRSLIGGQLVVGYGTSEIDMLQNSKFRLVYTVTEKGPAQRAPVQLGTSADFAILAKAAISTVPGSAISGNIGVSPAAASYITGFALIADPSNAFATSTQVVGGGHVFAANYAVPTPTMLTTAVLDMQAAYSDAAGRNTPEFLNMGSGNLGGLTLEPGLYKWGSSVTLPTDLAISGGPNDVWIFQMSGDLAMSASKQVILSGGAQAKNIFWQVAGQVVIGTTAHFEGVVLAKTGITLMTGSSLNGRALAQTMVALDSATIVPPAP